MLNSLDLPIRPADCRVVVAMSGGVDSSVVAAVLKKEGYDVVGVTLQLYDNGAGPRRAGACCAGQDIGDARRVCEAIGVPHYVLDYEAAFRRAVIDPFAQAYAAGETPVPCVACNQTVKFRDLLGVARDLGADVLATGHYIESRALPGGGRALHRPRDLDRDQSYFLYGTTREQADFLRFPLGTLTKAETRALAETHGLLVAAKPDSQDICFVARGRYGDVVRRLHPGADRPGEIVDAAGRVLGHHAGVVDFTVGQRRGLRIAGPEPLYVVAIDAAAARVTVGPRRMLETRRLSLRDVNWLGEATGPATGTELFCKVRSTRPPVPARISCENGTVQVDLPTGEFGVSPGQAAVFFDGDAAGARLLGGGTIARTATPFANSMPQPSISAA